MSEDEVAILRAEVMRLKAEVERLEDEAEDYRHQLDFEYGYAPGWDSVDVTVVDV